MAVSEEVLEQRRGLRVGRLVGLFVAFVLAAAVGAGLVAGGLWLFHDSLAGRILPGVTAAGVDVGGMSPDQARAALTARYGSLSTGGLLLQSSLGSTTIDFAAVGRGADIDRMLADATARGRGGSWFEETIAAVRLRLQPEAIPLQLTYDHDQAAAAVDAWAARMASTPMDASVIRTTTGFATIPSHDGSGVDAAAALSAVDRAMRDPSVVADTNVAAPVVTFAPTLSTDAAEQARLGANAMARNLVITNGTRKWTLSAKQIRPWIGFDWVDGVYQPVLDTSLVPRALAPIGKKVAQPVHDAAFLKDKHGRIVGAMADKAGKALDPAATTDRVISALTARAAGQAAPPVKLAMAAVLPKTKTADVAKTAPLMVKLGSWTTYYQVAAHNGFGANITVPTRTLNGTMVQPGQTFDFWKSLGEVSFRTGYRLGGAIVGGHSVEGKALAGGICAASTTLFNAALRAGFEIDARQPHWYYITRYPLGLDATVSGSQTMRFTNDTPYPILIRGFASPGVVRYEIWGVPNGRTVSLSRPQVSNVVAGFDSTVRTASMRRGTSLRTEWPVDGKDVVVTRVVRDSHGRVIHRDTFVSHYHRMIGINLVGTG